MGLGNIKINLNLLDCKSLTTFGAAALDNSAAGWRTKAGFKAVTATTTALGRLVGAFDHDVWIILDQ